MSDKSLPLRVAGSVRRRVYPEVDRLRSEVATLRAQVKSTEREAKAQIKSEVEAVQLAAKEAAERRWLAQVDDVDQQTLDQWIWAIASLEDVQEGLRALPYPYERFVFVQSPVEETVPEHAPE